MFKGLKRYDEIREKLELAIDEIFLEYQDQYDMSGDIEPMQAFALEETTDKLTEIIQDVLQFEYDYFRG